MKAYPPGSTVPGYADQQQSWTYAGHLFHPYAATKERGRWKKTWDRVGPKFMRTDAEQQTHEDTKKKKGRKDMRVRLQLLLHPHAKTAKRPSARLNPRSAKAMGSATASTAAASSTATDGKGTSAPGYAPSQAT